MNRPASILPPYLPGFILSVFFCLATAASAELLVLEVVLNDMPKGEFFVERDEAGRFWLPLDMVDQLGIAISPAQTVEKSGTIYFSFDEFPAISSSFDEATLSLRLTAPPDFFPATTLDLAYRRPQNVLKPLEDSAFFNYQIDYDYDSAQSDAYGVETEIGLRRNRWLFLTDQRLEGGDSPQSNFTRFMTSLSYEWREEFKRLTIGDALTSGDILSPVVRLAGITYSRNFALDPQFVQYPTLEYAGSVSSPAEIDIYLNGMKIRSEKIPPGNFRLENFTGMMGYGDIEVVVRDRFGREIRMQSPYYLARQLLRPGLQEYSYSIGLLRENYATDDDSYGSPVLLGFHRYGWRQATAGYRLYADDELQVLTPRLDFLVSTYGLVNLTAGLSQSDDGTGTAGVLRYSFNRRPFSTYFSCGIYSQQFRSSAAQVDDRPKTELAAGIGWGNFLLGAFSFDMISSERQDGEQRRSIGLSYSRRLSRHVSMNLSYQRTQGDLEHSFTYLSFNYIPGLGPQVSARYEDQEESRAYTVQVQKNPPVGPGYGYQADIGQRSERGENIRFLAPMGEIRGRNGILRSDVRVENGGEDRKEFSLLGAGALSWVGGGWQLSRPVRDSFALVQTGSLAGVEVRHNGQSVGRTDSTGRVIIPEMNAYYDNHISINDKDVPFEYTLPEIDQYLSPPARSGSCVVFAVEKSQPVTGRLLLAGKAGLQPVEYREIELLNDTGGSLTIPTGRGGEFYFDPRDFKKANGDPAGVSGCRELLKVREEEEVEALTYRGKVWIDNRLYPLLLEIKPTDELFVNLGELILTMEAGNETAL